MAALHNMIYVLWPGILCHDINSTCLYHHCSQITINIRQISGNALRSLAGLTRLLDLDLNVSSFRMPQLKLLTGLSGSSTYAWASVGYASTTA